MEIKRDIYLQKIKNRMNNGMIKVITGLPEAGKEKYSDPVYGDPGQCFIDLILRSL
jgi:hypothetical protein